MIADPGFIHLHAHTAFSLREGALTLGRLIQLAEKDAQPALAVTDTNNLFAALEFSEKAEKVGVQAIPGVQLAVDFGDANSRESRGGAQGQGEAGHANLVLLAKTQTGYRNLMRLCSRAYLGAAPGDSPCVTLADLSSDGADLIVLTGGPDGALDLLLGQSRIDAALRSFSLFKPAKFISLHHLAVLRHAQRRWQESALLCRALLSQRLGSLRGLSKPSLLLLTDNLLRLGDLTGTYETLSQIYRRRLNLIEALSLQQLQLEYLARIGSFGPMLADVKARIELAELMPSPHAAKAQAFLSLAALKCGRTDLHQWLKRRAELLCEARTLVAERPLLAELWPDVTPAAAPEVVRADAPTDAPTDAPSPNPEVGPSTDR